MYGVACVLLFLMDYDVHTLPHLAFSPEKTHEIIANQSV